MFIAALFTIARTWKQPRCPSTDKWIRKLWYIYTMEYHSAIKKKKKNAFESVLIRWMKLEPIIQSKVSQKEKHQYSILMHTYMEFRKTVIMILCAKEMAIHSSILAWRIPWTEKPSRLQSMGSQRVGHDWATERNWTEYSIIYMYHIVFIHLSVDGHLGCFHVLNLFFNWRKIPLQCCVSFWS